MNWNNKHKPSEIENLRYNQAYALKLSRWLDQFYKNKILFTDKLNFAKNKHSKNKKSKNNSSTIKPPIAKPLKSIKKVKKTKAKPAKVKLLENNILVKNIYPTTIVIRGKNGIGKTTFIDLMLQDLGIKKVTIDFAKIQKEKHIKMRNFKDFLLCVISTNLFTQILSDSNQFAIVIDNMENLSLKGNISYFITNIYKHIKNTFLCPLIFIVNNTHIKFIKTLEKKGLEDKELFIEMSDPSEIIMGEIIDDIIDAENITNISDILYFKKCLIESSCNDIYQLILLFENIILFFGDYQITNKKISECCLLSSKKELTENIFKTTKHIFENFSSPDTALMYYKNNRTTLPLMIQCNYIECISKNNVENKLEIAEQISETISYSDLLEDDIRTYQNWAAYELHGIYSTVVPSFILSSMKNNNEQHPYRLSYIKDYNMISRKNINKRNILAISIYHKKDVFEYIYMSKLIKYMLLKEGQEILFRIFEYQGIDIKTLKYLIKIDKINSKQIYNDLDVSEEKLILSYLPKNKKKVIDDLEI